MRGSEPANQQVSKLASWRAGGVISIFVLLCTTFHEKPPENLSLTLDFRKPLLWAEPLD